MIYSEINEQFTILHLDSIVVLQKPNISNHINEMRSKIADTIQVDLSSISIKATTTDHLGYIGKGKGIASQAIATLILK